MKEGVSKHGTGGEGNEGEHPGVDVFLESRKNNDSCEREHGDDRSCNENEDEGHRMWLRTAPAGADEFKVMFCLLWNRAGDALDDVAGVTDVMIMVVLACAFVVLFTGMGLRFGDDAGFFEVLEVSVDRGEVQFWELIVQLGGCPGSVFQEEVEELVTVACAAQAGRFELCDGEV